MLSYSMLCRLPSLTGRHLRLFPGPSRLGGDLSGRNSTKNQMSQSSVQQTSGRAAKIGRRQETKNEGVTATWSDFVAGQAQPATPPTTLGFLEDLHSDVITEWDCSLQFNAKGSESRPMSGVPPLTTHRIGTSPGAMNRSNAGTGPESRALLVREQEQENFPHIAQFQASKKPICPEQQVRTDSGLQPSSGDQTVPDFRSGTAVAETQLTIQDVRSRGCDIAGKKSTLWTDACSSVLEQELESCIAEYQFAKPPFLDAAGVASEDEGTHGYSEVMSYSEIGVQDAPDLNSLLLNQQGGLAREEYDDLLRVQQGDLFQVERDDLVQMEPADVVQVDDLHKVQVDQDTVVQVSDACNRDGAL